MRKSFIQKCSPNRSGRLCQFTANWVPASKNATENARNPTDKKCISVYRIHLEYNVKREHLMNALLARFRRIYESKPLPGGLQGTMAMKNENKRYANEINR